MKKSILQITKSKTKTAILELFFNNPEKEYYLRQIEKLTGYSAGNIRREITGLEESGLFIHRMLGRVKLYRLNTEYPIYNELRNIIRKTIGIEAGLKNIIRRYADIKFAFIYGSFARADERDISDIDILIIGDLRPKSIKPELFEYQSRLGREINSAIYTEREFLDKVKHRNHFISNVAKGPKIFLKGTENEFRRFVQVRKTKAA